MHAAVAPNLRVDIADADLVGPVLSLQSVSIVIDRGDLAGEVRGLVKVGDGVNSSPARQIREKELLVSCRCVVGELLVCASR